MPRLTPEQSRLLDQVAAAHAAKAKVKLDAEAEARRLIRTKVEAAERAESRAVRAALDAGVPTSRVGRDGLSTSDWRTVGKVLELTADEAAADDAVVAAYVAPRARAASAAERAAWASDLNGPDDVAVRIDWAAYPPSDPGIRQTFGATVDLHGFVHKAARPRDRFDVLTDDTTDTWLAVAGSGPLGDCARLEPAVHAVIERAMADA